MTYRIRIVQPVLAMLLLAALFAAGCQQFTRQNFETVYVGMPDYAVKQKLGRPQESTTARWVYTREHPYYRAEIIFRDGRVTQTRWINERPE